jgi:hypothetical protein
MMYFVSHRFRRIESLLVLAPYELLANLRLCEALATIDVYHHWPEIQELLLQGLKIARQSGNDAQVIEHLARLGEYAVARGEINIGLPW